MKSSENNICACEWFIKAKIVYQKIKTKHFFDFILPAMNAHVTEFFSLRNEISFQVSYKHPISLVAPVQMQLHKQVLKLQHRVTRVSNSPWSCYCI